MSKIKISCIAPSLNHEKFVGFFIESILNQTEQNFELIIVDDASQDKNVDEILKFKDKRIKLIRHEYNKGIGQALNTAFKFVRGEYIVFTGTDDIFEPIHFETVSKYLDNNPKVGAYYCSLSLINDKNNIIKDPNNIYIRKGINRFDILNTIFFAGNNLLDPGKTMRYEVAKKQIPFSGSLLPLLDVKSHVITALNSDIYTGEQKLIKYRLSGVSNVKSDFFEIREQLETDLLMDEFLKIKDMDLLEKIFKNKIAETGLQPFEDSIPYFLGRMALLSDEIVRKNWGYRTVLRFLEEEKNSSLVYEKYNQGYNDLYNLLMKVNINIIGKGKKNPVKRFFTNLLCGVILYKTKRKELRKKLLR